MTAHADAVMPTMRIPRDVSESVNLSPGLGTAVGGMPPERGARQMRVAWDRVLGVGAVNHRSLRAAAEDELELLR